MGVLTSLMIESIDEFIAEWAIRRQHLVGENEVGRSREASWWQRLLNPNQREREEELGCSKT